MRPMGEVSLALLEAARKLVTPDRAPTLAELAAAANVGGAAARSAVRDLKRYGKLCIVRDRQVARRGRPVAEYALPEQVAEPARDELVSVLSMWVQR